jgi:sugar phosphate isomerase/epimerase
MNMDLSIATDYAADSGDPSPCLERIARAGFSHVHWCHHWCTDFVYSAPEIDQIERWLHEYSLKMLDLHGPVGPEKDWGSPCEYRRLAGVELVRNRLEMTARLGGDAVVMHPPQSEDWDIVRRSLDALQPACEALGVRIALENGDFRTISRVFDEYDPAFIGLCYDSGHGNLEPDGLRQLETVAHRLVAVHLHDNDGKSDQHKLPFTGTINWKALARVLADSGYTKCPNLEVTMRRSGFGEGSAFLAAALECGRKFVDLLNKSASDR